jgi:hypothetical protein
VLARERTCGTTACDPTDTAPATLTTTMDASAPAGTVAIDGGAEFTRSADVALTLAATDAAPGGGTGAGVAGVQVSDDGAFRCVANQVLSPDCPVTLQSTMATRLAGPDGVRTVWVRYRDGARPWTTGDPLGNGSTVASDTIVLDRTPPAVAMSLSTVGGTAGVRLDATASVSDATSGPDAATAAWTFGDGATATGLTASHTYAAAGTYAGAFTVNDRAGNTATYPFTVTVNAAGGTTVTEGTSQPQGDTTPAPTDTTVTTPAPVATTSPTATTSPAATTPRTVTTKRTPGRIAAVRVLGTPRARGTVRVRVTLRTRGPLRVAIARSVRTTVKKKVTTRLKTLGWTSRSAAGPKAVTVSLKAPAAGRYTLIVTAGKDTRRVAVRVRPAPARR